MGVHKGKFMLTEKNLALTRAEPSGDGGLQFVYRIRNYGLTACSPPKEDVAMIQWQVDVIKFLDDKTLRFEVCHTTDLANKTLTFRNDRTINEFLEKAFVYFEELNTLEKMMDKT